MWLAERIVLSAMTVCLIATVMALIVGRKKARSPIEPPNSSATAGHRNLAEALGGGDER